MTITIANEKFDTYPIPQNGVTFGKVQATGISPLLQISNFLVPGQIYFETVTIALEGVPTNISYSKPTVASFGSQTFNFRSKSYAILDVQPGMQFNVGGTSRYLNWTITGVDLNTPYMSGG